jgi:hypothetical protein
VRLPPIPIMTKTNLGQVLRNCDRTLTRVQRMITATQRNYRDALRELERLQALDPDADPQEFVTYVPKPQPEPAPVAAKPNQTDELMALIEEIESDETNSEPEWVAPPDYHLPGKKCPFVPIDPTKFKRCPVCY